MCSSPSYTPPPTPPTPKPVDPMVSPEQQTAGVGDANSQTGVADDKRRNLRIDLASGGTTGNGLAI